MVTGSGALRAQTVANAADVAVGVFLLIGVLVSVRPADETHPLGYGRERFFWSLFAALGIFVGGGGLAVAGAIGAALHPSHIHSYPVGYAVLAATFLLDAWAFGVALRPALRHAANRGISLARFLPQNTDTASTTVVVSGGCAVVGAVVAAAGLALSQLTGSATPDTVASALIGVLLLVASVLLLQTNRELLTGRGLPPAMLREMTQVIAAQAGVVGVGDLFGVVVGPGSLIVDGDITFDDDLDVPAVERTIMQSAAALRERWPTIDYIYLTPVPQARARRWPWRSLVPAVDGNEAETGMP